MEETCQFERTHRFLELDKTRLGNTFALLNVVMKRFREVMSRRMTDIYLLYSFSKITESGHERRLN